MSDELLSYRLELPKHGKDLDFVDLDLQKDVQVYVDPILLYQSPRPLFNEAHTLIIEFFDRAIQYVKSHRLKQAESMCQFPDAENGLGIADQGPGHGPRRELGKRIFNELVRNKDIQEHGLVLLNELQLLIHGIAFDLVSDAAVQISKSVFIKYTQDQCALWGIETEEVPLNHVYDWENGEWDSIFVKLPLHPRTGVPILLTPRTVVRRYPEGNYSRFFDEIYKYVLYEKEKATLWRGVGKQPKITFSSIAEKYRNKKSVVEFVQNNPESRRQFLRKIRPREHASWLGYLARYQEVNINQVLTPEAIDPLRKLFRRPQEAKVVSAAVPAVERQLNLSKPRRGLAPEIDQLLALTKERLVLLLGNYGHPDGAKRLEEIETFLSSKYAVLLLRDLRYVTGDSLEQAMLRTAAMARFVVAEDSYAGGQLYELASLKNTAAVTAVVRLQGAQASFMSLGMSSLHTNVSEFSYELIPANGINETFLHPPVDWAEQTLAQQDQFFRGKYPWA